MTLKCENESDSGCTAVRRKSMSEKFSRHLAAHNHPCPACHSLLSRIAAAVRVGVERLSQKLKGNKMKGKKLDEKQKKKLRKK